MELILRPLFESGGEALGLGNIVGCGGEQQQEGDGEEVVHKGR